jgi:hypothetical protein
MVELMKVSDTATEEQNGRPEATDATTTATTTGQAD